MLLDTLQALGHRANCALVPRLLQCALEDSRGSGLCIARSGSLRGFWDKSHHWKHCFFLMSAIIVGLVKGASVTWHSMECLAPGHFNLFDLLDLIAEEKEA